MSNSISSHPSFRDAKYWQEDEITQECKELISSLPKEKGWVLSHLYQYQGLWLPSGLLQGVVTCQQHFHALETDLLLITPPKCGTTWLKALVFAVVNRASMPPSGQDHPIMTQNPHELVPFIEADDLSKLSSPRVLSSHIPFESLPISVSQTGCKTVYLCRDPKDAFISLWHFSNKLRPKDHEKLKLEEAYDKFCKGVCLFGPFWDHVLGYWKYSLKNPNNMLFLKFEDLKEDPKLHLKKLAKFCGCPFSLEEENKGIINQIIKLCSFDNLSNLEVNNVGKMSNGVENNVFFRKGGVGDWTNYLTPKMVLQFDKFNQEKLGPLGLLF